MGDFLRDIAATTALPWQIMAARLFGSAILCGVIGFERERRERPAGLRTHMLIGLAAKNAILIVEFAKLSYERGKPLVDAAIEGARLRLRPILMTSFAFILGSVPLAIASSRNAFCHPVLRPSS